MDHNLIETRDFVDFAGEALDFLKSELQARGQADLIPLLDSAVYLYTVEASNPQAWSGGESIHALDMQQALNRVQWAMIELMPCEWSS